MPAGSFATVMPGKLRQCSRPGRGVRSASIGAVFALCLSPLVAWCGETVSVCYNWSCSAEAWVSFPDPLLAGVAGLLKDTGSAAEERERIAQAVGQLYGEAARQSPISDDRPGNTADAESPGRMDCIDHATTTTRLLRLLEARGWLRWHRVLEPALRAPYIVNQHFAAVLEEQAGPSDDALAAERALAAPVPAPAVPDYIPVLLAQCDCQAVLADLPAPPAPPRPVERHPGARYVVDSWFVLPGAAPVVLPLANWLKGEGPDVD